MHSRAREDPGALHVGLDASLDALRDASSRARRRRLDNALFVHAGVEALPVELDGLVTSLTAVLPWGSLLRALALPDSPVLERLHALLAPGAPFEAILSMHPRRDTAEFQRLGLDAFGESLWMRRLCAAYQDAGFTGVHIAPLPNGGLASYRSTWAKRLARDPERQSWRLAAQAPPARGPAEGSGMST